MRLGGTVFIASLMMTAGAQASSFVAIAAPKAKISNSMVVIDAPHAAPPAAETSGVVPLAFAMPEIGAVRMVKVSASIVAFESTIPNVAYENVAAISPQASKPKPVAQPSTPMVMRGGIIGDAFASPVAATERPVGKATAEHAEKSPATASAEPSGPIPRKSVEKPADRRAPKAPPEPMPVAPPPVNMPRLEDIR